MTEITMGAEHVSGSNPAKQEPKRQQPLGLQPLRFAGEGVLSGQNSVDSSDSDLLSTNQYDARLGGTAAGQPPFRQGSAPETQPDPHKPNKLQAALLATGVTTLVGTAVVLLGSVLSRGGSEPGRQDPNVGASPDVTQVDPVGKTVTPTVEIPKTPTQEATATVEASPSYGKYQSIDELPITPEKKDLLKEILKDSRVFITTDRTIVAVDNDVMTRDKYAQLHSIGLNTNDYPDAAENLDEGIDIGQYEAWKAENKNSTVTLEEYLKIPAEKRNQQYSLRGYKNGVFPKDREMITVNPSDFRVIKVTNKSDLVSIWNTSDHGEFYEKYPGIFVVNVFSRDPVAKNRIDGDGNNVELYQFAALVDMALASMSDQESDSVINGPHGQGTGTLSSLVIPIANKIHKEHIPSKSKPVGWNSIFRTTGTTYTP